MMETKNLTKFETKCTELRIVVGRKSHSKLGQIRPQAIYNMLLSLETVFERVVPLSSQ